MRARLFILTCAVICSAALNACASKGASHIGNPLTLPGRAIVNGIQNASYEARRSKLSQYVRENRQEIYTDIDMGGGAALLSAMNIARVPDHRRGDLISELSVNPQIYRQSDIEPLIVAIMVHGD